MADDTRGIGCGKADRWQEIDSKPGFGRTQSRLSELCGEDSPGISQRASTARSVFNSSLPKNLSTEQFAAHLSSGIAAQLGL